MKPTLDDVQVLLTRFDESEWDELHVEGNDFQMHVYKSPHAERVARAGARALVPMPADAVASAQPAAGPAASTSEVASAQPAAAAAPVTPAGHIVRAPSLGTFYRAPKPGAPAFVEVGSAVTPDTQLCLLEVMKLYTAVEAEQFGTVQEILVADGELVEFDQPLFVIRPNES